jgi:hypothetical protein
MLGLSDLNYDGRKEEEFEVAEEDEVEDTQASMKISRTQNYGKQEGIALCRFWMNVLLDPSIGTDQSEDFFWIRI